MLTMCLPYTKHFAQRLNIRHLFVFVWEALQMTKTWSHERSQHWYCNRKLQDALWPINQT